MFSISYATMFLIALFTWIGTIASYIVRNYTKHLNLSEDILYFASVGVTIALFISMSDKRMHSLFILIILSFLFLSFESLISDFVAYKKNKSVVIKPSDDSIEQPGGPQEKSGGSTEQV